jgi:hypothetical protein
VHSSPPWVGSIYSTVLNVYLSSAWDAVHSWLEGTESIVYHTIGWLEGTEQDCVSCNNLVSSGCCLTKASCFVLA